MTCMENWKRWALCFCAIWVLGSQRLLAQETPVVECSGCALEAITYRDGFFLGAQPIPGCGIGWTPDPASTSGFCQGTSPNCDFAGCKFMSGTVRVTCTAGPVEVHDPGIDAVRAGLDTGDAANFPVGDPDGIPLDMACASFVFTEILDIVVNPGQPNEDLYHVSVHCTTCS